MKWSMEGDHNAISDCKRFRIAINGRKGKEMYTPFVAEDCLNYKGEKVKRWYPIDKPTSNRDKAKEAAEQWAQNSKATDNV